MPLQKLLRKIFSATHEARGPLVVFILLIAGGTWVYHLLEGWTLFDSLYFSVITLTTIGYGDVHPTLVASKAFTMVYVLIGVGLLLYIFTIITRHVFEDEKKEIHRIDEAIDRLEQFLKKK